MRECGLGVGCAHGQREGELTREGGLGRGGALVGGMETAERSAREQGSGLDGGTERVGKQGSAERSGLRSRGCMRGTRRWCGDDRD